MKHNEFWPMLWLLAAAFFLIQERVVAAVLCILYSLCSKWFMPGGEKPSAHEGVKHVLP